MIEAHDGIDHAYVKVADIGAARQALDELGFTLTSRDERPDISMALSSVVFPQNWIAFSGPSGPGVPPDPTGLRSDAKIMAELPEAVRSQLVGLGLQPMLILAVPDMPRFHAGLAAQELEPSAPAIYPRPTTTENGPAEIRFEMAVSKALAPGGDLRIVGLRHLTPGLFFRPALTAHANGAMSLAGIRFATRQKQPTAARLGALLGGGSTVFACRVRDIPVRLDAAATVIEVAVADAAATRRFLRARRVDFVTGRKSIAVRDRRLGDLLLRFVQAGAASM